MQSLFGFLRTLPLWEKGALCLAIIMLGWGAWEFAELLRYEAHPAAHLTDGLIFTAVGRGILNGLEPYRDLFEVKPPGMFLLSALSLAFSHGLALANLLQAAVELGAIAAIILTVIVLLRHLEPKRWLLVLGVSYALLLVSYLITRSGGFVTESFGAFFLLAYIALVALWRNPKSILFQLLSAACLAAAIGLKEPFVLVAFIAAVLLTARWKDLLWTFALPLLLALIGGTIFMAATGLLEPYWNVYLPEMMGGRLMIYRQPHWIIAFLPHYLLLDQWHFSPWFALTTLLLWLGTVIGTLNAWEYPRRLAGIGIILACFVGLLLLQREILFYGLTHGYSYEQLFLPVYTLFPLYWLILWWRARTLFPILFLSIHTLYGAVLAVGIGGFLSQQYGFSVPVFAAILIVFIRLAITQWDQARIRLFTGALVLLALLGLVLLPTPDYDARIAERVEAERQATQRAETVDTLLDRCGEERYVLMSDGLIPYAYTKHSPAGPAFTILSFTFPQEWREAPLLYLRDTFVERLKRGNIVFIKADVSGDGSFYPQATDELPQDVIAYLTENFTTNAPACAGSPAPKLPITILYRKGWDGSR